MWYSAYGSTLTSRAVAGGAPPPVPRPPAMKPGRPAVLDNYRLGFSIFSEYWAGGIADIVYDPGKYVAGVLFDLTEADLETLDRKVNRRADSGGKGIGAYNRIDVQVLPDRESVA